MKAIHSVALVILLFGFLPLAVSAFEQGDLRTSVFLRSKIAGCSAFFGDFSISQNNSDVRLVSAQHCNLSAGSDIWDVFTNAQLSGVDKTMDGEKLPTPFSVNSAHFKIHRSRAEQASPDMAFWKVDSAAYKGGWMTPPSRVFKLARELPHAGEQLTHEGYPKAVGPLRQSCRYAGVVLTPLENSTDMHVFSAMLCDGETPHALSGFSGGPVFNDREEVVGVLSQFGLRRFTNGKLLGMYTPLTVPRLNGNADRAVADPAPGMAEFRDVLVIAGTEQTYDGEGQMKMHFYETASGMAWACYGDQGRIVGVMVVRIPDKNRSFIVFRDNRDGSYLSDIGPYEKYGPQDARCGSD